ncbi:MAG: CPBP family intramembrane metalloprotease [Erysipelotrichaceae bacterium]|nr:CPBP family intramembrane metalloprotease [Erysipelotrichaceae bacterium]
MKKRYKCKQCYSINIDAYDHCVSCGSSLKHPKSTLFRVVFQVFGLMAFYLGLQGFLSLLVSIPVLFKNLDSVEVIDGFAIFNHFSDALLTSIILSALIFIGVIGVYYYRKRHIVRPPYRFDRLNGYQITISLIMGVGCVFLSQLIISISESIGILNFDNLETYEQLISSIIGQSPTWLILLTIGIVAPIAEELLFRGLIFHMFNRHMNVKIALIVQGLLFGAFHMNLVQSVYASVLGIVLGITYLLTGSLWIPIIIHIVNNSVALLLPEVWMSDPLISIGLMSLLLLVPLGLWLLYRKNSGKYILNLNT